MIDKIQDVNQYLAGVNSFLLNFYKESNKEKQEKELARIGYIKKSAILLFSQGCGFDDIQAVALTDLLLKQSRLLSDMNCITRDTIAERLLLMLKGDLRAGFFVGVVVNEEDVYNVMRHNTGNDTRDRIIATLSLICKKVKDYYE